MRLPQPHRHCLQAYVAETQYWRGTYGEGELNERQGRERSEGLMLVLQRGMAQLPDLHVSDSSEAMLSGRKPPFRLLVRAVATDGRKVNIRHAVSEGFVVCCPPAHPLRSHLFDALRPLPALSDRTYLMHYAHCILRWPLCQPSELACCRRSGVVSQMSSAVLLRMLEFDTAEPTTVGINCGHACGKYRGISVGGHKAHTDCWEGGDSQCGRPCEQAGAHGQGDCQEAAGHQGLSCAVWHRHQRARQPY